MYRLGSVSFMIYKSQELHLGKVTNMSLLKIVCIILMSDGVWGLRSRSSTRCGVSLSVGKIVGGVDSGGYRYPWFALLLLKKNSYIPVPVCAGSLITTSHVLTAAHCFTISASVNYDDLFSVALGVYDICNDNEKTREMFNVAGVAVHEKYRKTMKFHDIAIIKLNRPAGFVAICLPISGVLDITEVALLIGFGVTSGNSNFVPCHMMEANVTKFSKRDCMKTKLPLEDKREPSVICAGGLKGDVDSCYGDSGGPLQTRTSDGRYVIAGIVSYGYGCATPDIPGVYTNVGSYLDWISEKISYLDSKESNVNESTIHLPGGRRGPKRPTSGVTYPRQVNSSHFNLERTQIGEQQFFKKAPTFTSVFFEGEKSRKGESENSRRSRVSFPE